MKANKSKQEQAKKGLVPLEQIEEKAKPLRVVHEDVTDAQADLVHMILHDGCNPTEASKRLGRNKAWAYNSLNKQHVISYRNELAMTTLGWSATQAMATMKDLLESKSQHVRLEAARDLMDRAGLRNDAPQSVGASVQINFNV